ncbi:unnamed protein product [Phytomonas sp. EM1]|nr:unnamed protein product [Phytomonas sp. EM1]|eukprot:CCW60103.1 unnamed protein product [Phytomonas sp. isolate EM1]
MGLSLELKGKKESSIHCKQNLIFTMFAFTSFPFTYCLIEVWIRSISAALNSSIVSHFGCHIKRIVPLSSCVALQIVVSFSTAALLFRFSSLWSKLRTILP